MKTFRILCLLFCLFTLNLRGQIIGGFENSTPIPRTVEASKLTGGFVSGDVNLFNGSYSSNYSLGSVATPAGLEFELQLQYNSTKSTGSRPAPIQGGMFGEGWNLNLPTITISTVAYNEFNNAIDCGEGTSAERDKLFDSKLEALKEGDLYWFEPKLSTPEASGRMVFKYYDKVIEKAVFVMRNFDQYVEAYFDGNNWLVKMPNGNEYHFGTKLSTLFNPSNQRVSKSSSNEDILTNDLIANNCLPKGSVLSWHCDKIENPNLPSRQKIEFEYEMFGKFDYYKFISEQQHVKRFFNAAKDLMNQDLPAGSETDADFFCEGGVNSVGLKLTSEKDVEYKATDITSTYEKIRLNRIYSSDNSFGTYSIDNEFEVLKLNYNNLEAGAFNSNVEEYYDEHYIKRMVIDQQSFEDWKRYLHPRALEIKNGEWKSNPSSSSNAYVSKHGGKNSYYRKFVTSSADEVSLNHSYAESGKFSRTLFKRGRKYEVEVDLYYGSEQPKYCNLDLRLVAGVDDINADQEGFIDADAYEDSKPDVLYSSMGNALKWNPSDLKDGVHGASHNNGPGEITISGLFSMPMIPLETENPVTTPGTQGVFIQVGGANSDVDHMKNYTDIKERVTTCYPGQEGGSDIFCNKGAYYNYFHSDREDLTALGLGRGASIAQNFGIGLPWHMLDGQFSDLIDPFDDRRRVWWSEDVSSEPTLLKDIYIKAVRVYEYAPVPVVLKSVEKYINNGEIKLDLSDSEPVRAVVLDYDAQEVFFSNSNQDADYKQILLKKIKEKAVDPSGLGISSTEEYIETSFAYEFAPVHAVIDPDVLIGYAPLLNRVTDHLGGVTYIEYNPLGLIDTDEDGNNVLKVNGDEVKPSASSNYSFSYITSNSRRCLEQVSRLGIPFTQQSNFLVKNKFVVNRNGLEAIPGSADEEIAALQASKWSYEYSNPVGRSESYNNLGASYGTRDFKYSLGYRTVKVFEPLVQEDVNRVYSKYKFGGTVIGSGQQTLEGEMHFGKLLETRVFDEQARLLRSESSEYSSSIAYWNGKDRGLKTDNEDYSYFADNANEYGDLVEEPLGSALSCIPEPLAIIPAGVTENLNYLELTRDYPGRNNHSYFTKLISTVSREYNVNSRPLIADNTVADADNVVDISWDIEQDWKDISAIDWSEEIAVDKYEKIADNIYTDLSNVEALLAEINQNILVESHRLSNVENVSANHALLLAKFDEASSKVALIEEDLTIVRNSLQERVFDNMDVAMVAVRKNTFDLQDDIEELSETVPEFNEVRTQYEYYDADLKGETSCKFYLDMLDAENSVQLDYEPSWSLFAKTTTISQDEEHMSRTEYARVYDYVNVLDGGHLDLSAPTVGMAYQFRDRSSIFQERNVTNRFGDVSTDNSTFFEYSSDWGQVAAPSIETVVKCGYEEGLEVNCVRNGNGITDGGIITEFSEGCENSDTGGSNGGGDDSGNDDEDNALDTSPDGCSQVYRDINGCRIENIKYIPEDDEFITFCGENLYACKLQTREEQIGDYTIEEFVELDLEGQDLNGILQDEDLREPFYSWVREAGEIKNMETNEIIAVSDFKKDPANLVELQLSCNTSNIVPRASIEIQNIKNQLLSEEREVAYRNSRSSRSSLNSNTSSLGTYYFDGLEDIGTVQNVERPLEDKYLLKRQFISIGSLESAQINPYYDPRLPQEMPYENIKIKEVESRNQYGQTIVEYDVNENKHSYEYNVPRLRHIKYSNSEGNYGHNTAYGCHNHYVQISENVGKPISYTITSGGLEQRTEFTYHKDKSIASIIGENGQLIEYTYDQFGRKSSESINGEVINTNSYSLWNGSTSDDFANSNVIRTITRTSRYSAQALQTSAFLDRNGKEAGSQITAGELNSDLSFHTTSDKVVVSGSKEYDAWGRTVGEFESFVLDQELDNPISRNEVSSSADLKRTVKLEPNQRNRTLAIADYGIDINSVHTVRSSEEFISAEQFVTELALTEGGAFDRNRILNLNSENPAIKKVETLDQDNKLVIEYYNALNELIAKKNSIGANEDAITLFRYDASGNVIESVNPTGQLTTYTYNNAGLLIEKSHVDEGITKFIYDKNGQVRFKEDELARQNGYVWFIEYDKLGNVIATGKLQEGRTPLFGAEFGELDSYEWLNIGSRDGGKTYAARYFYSNHHFDVNLMPTAMLEELKSPEGKKGRLNESVAFDEKGKPIEITYMGYDRDGNIAFEVKQFNHNGITSLSKGFVNLVQYPKYNFAGDPLEKIVDFGADGELDLHYKYNYDEYGYLADVRNVLLGEEHIVQSFEYDLATGLKTREKHFGFGSGLFANSTLEVNDISYSYDNRRRLTSRNGKYFDQVLGYDATDVSVYGLADYSMFNGNIKTVSNNYKLGQEASNFESASSFAFQYDDMNRLTSATGLNDAYSSAYSFDKIGNITTLVRKDLDGVNSDNISYDYSSSNNHLLQVVNNSMIRGFAYDVNGNMISDSKNGLSSVDYIQQNLSTNLDIVTDEGAHQRTKYQYGVQSQRIFKLGMTSKEYTEGVTTGFDNFEGTADYALLTSPNETSSVGTVDLDVAEYYLRDLTGQQYIFDFKNHRYSAYFSGIQKLSGEYEVDYGTEAVSNLTVSIESTPLIFDEQLFFSNDYLGNQRVATKVIQVMQRELIGTEVGPGGQPLELYSMTPSLIGELAAAYDYYPYGKISRQFLRNQQTRFLTTGHERDMETGYDNRHARLYDAEIGRFFGVDMLSAKYPGFSSYHYVLGNPAYYIDPDGREGWGFNLYNPLDNSTTRYWTSRIRSTVEDIGTSFYNVLSFFSDDKVSVPVLSEGATQGTKYFYDEKTQTWRGKDLKVRPMTWGGNGPVGGKNKFGKATSGLFRTGGFILAGYTVFQTEREYSKTKDGSKRLYSHSLTGIGLAQPKYALFIAAGDYLGQKYSKEINDQVNGGTMSRAMGWILENLLKMPASEESPLNRKENLDDN